MERLLDKTLPMEIVRGLPDEERVAHAQARYDEFYEMTTNWFNTGDNRKELETLGNDLAPILQVHTSDEPFLSPETIIDITKLSYVYARLQMERGAYK